MENELVSVIMPTYNRPQYLVESVQSVINQTYSNFELIICDDNSTICNVQTLLPNDKRITYIKNETNIGQAKTVINGIKNAGGNFVCIFHDDDIMSPNYLEQFVNCFRNNLQADFVFSDHYLTDENGTVNMKLSKESSTVYKRAEMQTGIIKDVFNEAVYFQSIPLISLMWKREKYFIPKHSENTGPAIDLWLRFLLYKNRLKGFYLSETLNYYRQHNTSQTSAGDGNYMLRCLAITYKKMINKNLELKYWNIVLKKYFLYHALLLKRKIKI
ncbi:MAG: glycosyltransferase family 2 protein [Bacteroidetes bacterium]|nr:glycosyltransferase family 2 protein [Bacteroidota bacterium]MBS1649263.1 glycosyltransferase family 2 protein [Bacteroidota bacterium]